MRICLLEDHYHSPVQVGEYDDDSEYEYSEESEADGAQLTDSFEEDPEEARSLWSVLMRIFSWKQEGVDEGEWEEEEEDDGSFEDAACDPRPYLMKHEIVSVQITKETAVAEIIKLARQGFDLFFNQCAGAWDESYTGIEVVQTLERLNVPFTGADSDFYEPSREAMKRVCSSLGIGTPAYVIARSEDDVSRAGELLRFPMIVKHPSSYSSTDLTPESKVESVEGLAEKARHMIDHYGAALIEEFIEGREFTVLVAENPEDPTRPVTYVPVEILFPAGESFKHYGLKFVTYKDMEDVPVTDPELDARLREISADFFLGMRGVSFGRCDLRMDEDGELYMLEINPNCGVFYPASDPGSADMSLLHDPAGHQGFTDLLLEAALARHDRKQRGWEALWTPGSGYSLHATRPFEAGDMAIGFEDTPHTLVTLSHVEAHWNERQKDWFRRYAWPVTDEMWVTWSEDPEDWKPVRHSCDPNCWLVGLDLVARRDVASGEELTVDYATFYNEQMTSFSCACGAEACRGTIQGDDFLQPFVDRYEGHVSDYVQRRRAAAPIPT